MRLIFCISLNVAQVLSFAKTPGQTPLEDYEYDYEGRAEFSKVGGDGCDLYRTTESDCNALREDGLNSLSGKYEKWQSMYRCDMFSKVECRTLRGELQAKLLLNADPDDPGRPTNYVEWPAEGDVRDNDGPYSGINRDKAIELFGPYDTDKQTVKDLIDQADGGLVRVGQDYTLCNYYRPKVYNNNGEDICAAKCGPCLTPEERLKAGHLHELTQDQYSQLIADPDQLKLDALLRCTPCRQQNAQMKHKINRFYTDCYPDEKLTIGVSSADDDQNIPATGCTDAMKARWSFDPEQRSPLSEINEDRAVCPNPFEDYGSENGGWKYLAKKRPNKPAKWMQCPKCEERGDPGPDYSGRGCPEFCRTRFEKTIGCGLVDQNLAEGTDFCLRLSSLERGFNPHQSPYKVDSCGNAEDMQDLLEYIGTNPRQETVCLNAFQVKYGHVNGANTGKNYYQLCMWDQSRGSGWERCYHDPLVYGKVYDCPDTCGDGGGNRFRRLPQNNLLTQFENLVEDPPMLEDEKLRRAALEKCHAGYSLFPETHPNTYIKRGEQDICEATWYPVQRDGQLKDTGNITSFERCNYNADRSKKCQGPLQSERCQYKAAENVTQWSD